MEAVAITSRDASLDAAGGCPASPSDNVLRESGARRGARLQRLTTGSPSSCLACWSCHARFGVFGSGQACWWPYPRSRAAHPIRFEWSNGRRRQRTDAYYLAYLANQAATSRVTSMQHQHRGRTADGPISSMVLPPPLTPPQGRWPRGQPHVQPPPGWLRADGGVGLTAP